MTTAIPNTPRRACGDQLVMDVALPPTFDADFRDQLGALFAWRRDVRRFRTDPVAKELIAALLTQAGTAPSVGLSEPWRFVHFASRTAREAARVSFEAENAAALSDRDSDAALYARLKLSGMEAAPVQFAVFCDDGTPKGRGLGQRTMPEARRYSVVCAILQLWLAARAHGVGMGWVSILDPDAIHGAAGVPPEWTLIAYLCLGYPEENHTDCELQRAGWEPRNGHPVPVQTV